MQAGTLDDLFITDPKMEKDGIVIDYDLSQFRIARAGGANKSFIKAVEARTRPYRRAIKNDMFPLDRLEDLMIEVFVDTILLGWGSKEFGAGKIGIRGPDRVIVPLEYSKVNALSYFRDRRDLFKDLFDQAESAGNFRLEEVEEEAKKS